MEFKLSDEQRKCTGIYKISNSVNSKVYVGSAYCLVRRYDMHKSRLARGIHHSRALQSAVNKYGLDKFAFELVEICAKADVIKKEQYWINAYNSYKNGYNGSPTAQNNAGLIVSEETKEKLSKALKGKKRSKESIEKSSAAHKAKNRKISEELREILRAVHTGRKHSQQEKAKRSQSLKAHRQTESGKALHSWLGSLSKGRKMSEKVKQEMSARRKGNPGHPITEETRRKIGEKNKGRQKTLAQIELARTLGIERTKNGIYINPPKPVNQFDLQGNFIKQYPSLMSVKDDGFTFNNVSKVCLGERKSAGGFKWQYA